jgi:hypothetical protein
MNEFDFSLILIDFSMIFDDRKSILFSLNWSKKGDMKIFSKETTFPDQKIRSSN